MTYTFNDPDPYDPANELYDPEDEADFLSVFYNFAPTVPGGATKPSFTAFSDDTFKAHLEFPYI